MNKKTMQEDLAQALPEPPLGMLVIDGPDGVARTPAGDVVSAEEQGAWLANPAHVLFRMPDNGRDPQPGGEGNPDHQPDGEPPALPRVLPHAGKVTTIHHRDAVLPAGEGD